MTNPSLFLGCIILLAGCLHPAAQSVPRLIYYQGQLRDAGGIPLPTQDYDLEVSLFPVSKGESLLSP